MDRAFVELYGVENATRGIVPDGKTDPMLFGEALVRCRLAAAGSPPPPELVRRYETLFPEEMAAPPAELMPGVRELLHALSGHPQVLLGLLTGNLERTAQLKVATFGLDRYFAFGATAWTTATGSACRQSPSSAPSASPAGRSASAATWSSWATRRATWSAPAPGARPRLASPPAAARRASSSTPAPISSSRISPTRMPFWKPFAFDEGKARGKEGETASWCSPRSPLRSRRSQRFPPGGVLELPAVRCRLTAITRSASGAGAAVLRLLAGFGLVRVRGRLRPAA